MVVHRTCIVALLLGLAGAVNTHGQPPPQSSVAKLFLQVRNATEHGVAQIEADVVGAVSVASKAAKRVRRRSFSKNIDTTWSSNLVIIPCLIVGIPLYQLWNRLEPGGKEDDIYTAMDADLREVAISDIGASGVALLRRRSDRHVGIMFAFTGIMLQTIFLYFIAVYCFRIIAQEAYESWRNDKVTQTPTPIALLFCSLFCNTMTCCSSFIVGFKVRATKAPEGYEELHETLVLLDSFVIPSVCMVVGALYLCASNGISELVFNSTAMAFICGINMQIAGLMSWSLSGHGGRAFQPANISIKDSENSTLYANYSLIASAVVALVAVPISWLCGII